MATERHSHTFLHIIIVVLIMISVFAIAKHLVRQEKWNSYVVDSQKAVANYNNLNSIEDGNMIAATIVNVPEANPLIKQSTALENYIKKISTQMERDIVITDPGRKILADTFSSNVGKNYSSDKGGEVAKTIGDGNPRTFLETSSDYPGGINETVIAIKNASGATVGALIISNSTIFGK